MGTPLTRCAMRGSMGHMTEHWTTDAMPDQSGRIVLITGAAGGLGLATARELARRGAHVILAVRSRERGRQAIEQITAEQPRASLEAGVVDLADLEAVRAYAGRVRDAHPRLDLLINNAGVMAPPRTLTPQGHELQFAVNHLAHFALPGLLLARLAAGHA